MWRKVPSLFTRARGPQPWVTLSAIGQAFYVVTVCFSKTLFSWDLTEGQVRSEKGTVVLA